MNRKKMCFRASKTLKKTYQLLCYFEIAIRRKAFIYDQLKVKKAVSSMKPLTKSEKAELKKYWKGIHIDLGWPQFYNWVEREKNGSFDPRYIPLDMEYCCIDDWFNDTMSANVLDDKNFYDLYFPNMPMPETVLRIIDGHLLDKNFSPIDLQSAIQKCQKEESVISKPAVLACAGTGILFWNTGEDIEVLKEILQRKGSYVIQKIVKQHTEISRLHESSVNTIRIVTCYLNGEMSVLSSVIRMGANGTKVDNATLGGYFCGINDDGSLKKYGYTKTGTIITQHPQGAVFAECRIPNFDKCKELVCKMAYRFIRTSKLMSWDLAIREDGMPILIEVNMCYGGTDIHQIANGPMFGDKTEYILREVFKHRKYRWVNRFLK